ncbi:MAG: RNA-binding S4 domain-containing protein [Pseudomonadota bacterium]|nr:RNA-binding S4 domain-containing protein [Pseudomonadota bacterium]
MTQDTIRLDLWLWYARFFKSRTLAARAIRETRIRLNRRVVTKVSQPVRVGDVLTFPRADELIVVEVLDLGERRGPAAEARGLFRDLNAPELPVAVMAGQMVAGAVALEG